MKIVAAGIETAAELAGLATKTFLQTFLPLGRDELVRLHSNRHLNRTEIERLLRGPGYSAFIAIQEDELIGYAALYVSAAQAVEGLCNAVELQRIYLLAPWQGRGWGGKLLDFCIRWAINSGYEVMWTSCWEKNQNALGFFRHKGFCDMASQAYSVGGILHLDRVLCRYIALTGGEPDLRQPG